MIAAFHYSQLPTNLNIKSLKPSKTFETFETREKEKEKTEERLNSNLKRKLDEK